jgi:hypothetical protein
MQDVMARLMHRGMTTDSGQDIPIGYVEVDTRLQQDVREVIALGGAVYLGIDILESWTESNPGETWDVTDSPIGGGHCIIAAGYDADGLDVISWGMRFRMTNAAFARYCDEAYWIADRNWFGRNLQTPGGITQDELAAAMQGVKEAG